MRYSIDHLIQRHLDGELSDAERAEFEHLLEHSAEAREELRRAEQIRSTARRAATMHTPSAWVETELLAMVRAGAAAASPAPVSKEAETLRPAVAHGRARRATALFATVACLMLLVLKVSDGPLPTTGTGIPGQGIAETGKDAGTIASISSGTSTSSQTLKVSNTPIELPTLIRRRRLVLRDNRHNGSESVAPKHVEDQTAPIPAYDPSNSSVSITQASAVPTYSSSESVAVADNSLIIAPKDDILPLAVAQQASLLNASVRGGLAGIRRDDWVQMNEMQVRLGVRLGKQDQLYAVVGSAPTITETRYKNSGLAVSSTRSRDNEKGEEGKGNSRARLLSAPPPELLVTFDDEMWGGLGYRRTLVESGGLQLAAGAQAGTSGTAARFAGEVSGAVRLTSNVSVELSGSVTQVVPFTREVELSSAVAAEDRMLYNGTIRQPAFVSLGAQIGLRVDIP